nr:MAG TPA: hypothetical protein [Caudoviricetes sp.]
MRAAVFCYQAQKSFANLHFTLDKYTQCVYNKTIR